MIHWFEHLPIGWMSLVVFAVIYLVAGGIYWLVIALAVGERARAFKAISPGMLPPLGIIFGLLVAFMAAQVWGDLDRAHAAVNREASALRAIVLLARRGSVTAPARYEPIAPAHALLALLPYTNLRARGSLGDAIRTLAPLAERVPVFDLGRGPLDRMAAAVEELAGLGVPA